MEEKKRLILRWIGDRLKEHSTRQGITFLLALAGYTIEPQWIDAIVLAGGFVSAIIAIITKDKQTV